MSSIRDYATPTQLRYLDAVEEHGSNRAAERALGLATDCVGSALRRLEAHAARQGYAPGNWDHPVAPGYSMGKVTVQRGPEGVERTWERMSPDAQLQRLYMEAAAAAMSEDMPPVKRQEFVGSKLSLAQSKLLNLYTITDAHVGMLAWHKEGGADWDLTIAERVLFGCFEQMVLSAPPARVGVINQLGDFLHSDGLIPITPTSGHILDQDGRFSKMVAVAIRLLRRMIALALAKHPEVIVLAAEGNHDLASSVWLRHMLKALYENEPRVTVIDSELPYYALQHGQTMLAFHHSHLKKIEQFPLVFAAQFPKVWGDTTKRYAHAGHRHHKQVVEHGGMIVTQHPTLAARDAYAARGAWFAERACTAITYHSEFGQVGEVTITPEMLT